MVPAGMRLVANCFLIELMCRVLTSSKLPPLHIVMRGSVVIQTGRDEVAGIVGSPKIQLGSKCRSPCYRSLSPPYTSIQDSPIYCTV
jgi:hypothetical protein